MKANICFLICFVAAAFSSGNFANYDDFRNHWKPVSVAPKTNQHTFYIALPQHNVDYIQQLLLHVSDPKSPNYGHHLSIEKILSIVQPSLAEKQPVLNWLSDYDVKCDDLGDCLRCTANISAIESLLRVQMYVFVNERTGGVTIRALQDYRVPESLQNNVVFIEGISGLPFPKFKSKINLHPKSHADSGLAARLVLERLYNISNSQVVNASVAAIEFGGQSGFSQSDIIQNQQLNAETEHKVSHSIGLNVMPDTETELDLQMMSQVMAGDGAQLWYYDTPHWMYSFAADLFNREHAPEIISMSWGWAEDQQCDITHCTNDSSRIYVERCNIEFAKVGLRGITMVAASGDAGSPGRTSESCLSARPINPVFPASSPWVLSVGATFVLAENSTATDDDNSPICRQYGCITGTTQWPTNFNYTDWTSGAGFGIYHEQTPMWQQLVVESYLNASGNRLPPAGNWNRNGRSYPDLTVVGHNCPVWIQGVMYKVDGTSCSAPTMAGIIGLWNDYRKQQGRSTLGFVNPLLYQIYEKYPDAFTDITVGYSGATEAGSCPINSDDTSNFGFFATPGFDAVNGMGFPNVNRIMQVI